MLSSARLGLLTAAVTTAITASVLPAVVSPADGAAGPTVSVHGRLLVVPAETPGGATRYGVALADGDIVPVRGAFDPDLRSGATFGGRLRVPGGVVQALSSRGESGARAALRVVDRRSLTLSVVGTPSISPADVSASVTPTTHQQFVAAIDNKGSLQTDSQLLAHVSAVGAYWEGESNGAISGITVPGAVTHYSTSLSTTDCGLGGDFFDVVQEAAEEFPSLDLSQSSPDQLVLFVPQSCKSGGVVGEGTLGDSFATGGALVVKATAAIEGTYAHETGHNYGFAHANARVGNRSLEYYGVYDVMGFALDGFNQLTALSTPFRVFQGVTDPGEIQDVDLGDGTSAVHATATIKPRSDDSGIRSVRVTNPDNGEDLYVDYRSGTGQDADSFYSGADGLYLTYDNDLSKKLFYGPGVTVNAARGGSGEDVLANASGKTFLGTGSSWSSASGLLTVTVTSLSPTGADVAVDYAPAQSFTSVGTPVIGGSVQVGGTVTLDPGTWSPTPDTTSVRWTADGQPVPDLNDRTRFKAPSSLAGTTLVATVTQRKLGFTPSSAHSAGVEVTRGTLASSRPTIVGSARVGEVLRARSGAWTAGARFSYAWFASGTRIRHQSTPRLTLTKAQKGKRIAVKVTGVKPGYTTVSRTSAQTPKVR
jgi:hypothetical protein